jgi:hypothetical protein
VLRLSWVQHSFSENVLFAWVPGCKAHHSKKNDFNLNITLWNVGGSLNAIKVPLANHPQIIDCSIDSKSKYSHCLIAEEK